MKEEKIGTIYLLLMILGWLSPAICIGVFVLMGLFDGILSDEIFMGTLFGFTFCVFCSIITIISLFFQRNYKETNMPKQVLIARVLAIVGMFPFPVVLTLWIVAAKAFVG